MVAIWEGLAVVHDAVPGRLRVRVDGLRHLPDLKSRLERGMAAGPGVIAVRASTLTGNVLVEFDPALPAEGILERLAVLRGGRPADGGPTQERPWHRLSAAEVAALLDTSPATGLSRAEADRRLAATGANLVTPPRPRASLAILAEQFKSTPVALLVGSAVVSLIGGAVIDAAIILGVVVVNAAIGFVTERQAERTIASLVRDDGGTALVRRDGRLETVEVAALVPGDVLHLLPGATVPADARVAEARNLVLDESVLTGESRAVLKTAGRLPNGAPAIADRMNMVYRGTVVAGGSGVALVVATGAATEMGMIQRLVGEIRHPPTPLQANLSDLGRRLVLLGLAVCGGVFVVGLLRGYGLAAMTKTAIALAVAAVPEGLPMVATSTLALGIRSLRRRGVVVRRLAAVETMGAVHAICFDKTGTLTENRMRVADLQAGLEDLPDIAAASPALRRLGAIAVLCSDARFRPSKGAGSRDEAEGTATEVALLRLAAEIGLDAEALRAERPRIAERYRDETRQSMATTHRLPDGGRLRAVKGSPPEVLAMCATHMRADGRVEPLDEATRGRILARNQAMAEAGLRVLGFADGPALGDEEAGLTWVGLAGMEDPVREGMEGVIALFHRSQIRTLMITGDQAATAAAVARRLRLGDGGPIGVCDCAGREAREIARVAAGDRSVQVFARVTPAQKLDIIRALQAGGQVVAMTGDGVNDGPALKAADIGVAMGRRGSDTARELADMVIEDDDLRTLAHALAQGRTIRVNIRKSIRFLISTNLSEIMVVLVATAAGMGQPLTPIQLLWINLVSDVLPGLALSFEAPERRALAAAPEDPARPFVSQRELQEMAVEAAIIAGGAMSAYAWGLSQHGPGTRAATMATTSLVTGQMLHALTCRSETCSIYDAERLAPNRALLWSVGGTLAAQALVSALPVTRRLLGLSPIGGVGLAVAAVCGVAPFLANEGLKALRIAGWRRREGAGGP